MSMIAIFMLKESVTC